jgi:CHRD domain
MSAKTYKGTNLSRRGVAWSKAPLCAAVAALGIAALLGSGSAVLADILAFKADLSGRGEAPPNDSVGTGHLEATLDTDTFKLTWTCTYSGLTGGVIGAHFHGPVSYIGMTSEENAPIQVGTPGNLASPFKGTSTIDATQYKDLKDGRWYFNVHTAKFPAGEIRGPIVRK